MTWSPSLMLARQKRETSRAQASCPCCAEATEPIRTNGMMKKNLAMFYAHPVMISARSNALIATLQCLTATAAIAKSSCPALCRDPRLYSISWKKNVDGRDKPGHDRENNDLQN